MIEVSPPHYRTWGGPGYMDISGTMHKEDMDSKLVWVDDWEKFRKLP